MDPTSQTIVHPNELGHETGLAVTTASSCGVVHVLRCVECGFESLLRNRFATHVPCAIKLDSYLIYTCSQCAACSTSQALIQEHGELCHADNTFTIEKHVEKFIKPADAIALKVTSSTTPIPNTKTEQEAHSPMNSSFTDGLVSLAADFNPRSSPRLSTMENAIHMKTLTSSASLQNTNSSSNRTGDWLPGMNPMTSFMDLMNIFSSTMVTSGQDPRKGSDPRSETEAVGCGLNGGCKEHSVQCPICQQTWTSNTVDGTGQNLEELAKHLALVHLLPFPAILNCLSVIALGSSQPGPLQSTISPQSHIDHSARGVGAIAQAFKIPQTQSNAIPAKNEMETTDWINRSTKVAHMDSVNSANSQFRNMKREHPNSESMEERTIWEDRNAIHTSNNQSGPTKSFNCPQCGRSCSSVNQLQQHLLQAHSEELTAMTNLGRWPFPSMIPPILPGDWSNTRTTNQSLRDTQAHEVSAFTGTDNHTTATTSLTPSATLSSSTVGVNSFDQSAVSTPAVNWHLAAAAAAAAAFGMPFPLSNSLGSMPLRNQNQPSDSALETGNTTAVQCSEPKRPKLQAPETRSIGSSLNNGMPVLSNESVNPPFIMFSPNTNHANTSDIGLLSMEALKLSNPLWSVPSSASLSSSSVAKFPEFPCPALLRPDSLPNYPPLVPPFPFCDSLSMLPSLYASVQQRTANSGALLNPPRESGPTHSPASLWNEERSDANTGTRNSINSGILWPSVSLRSSRTETVGSDHPGPNSTTSPGPVGSRSRNNLPKSPEWSTKATKELNKGTTNTSTPSSPTNSTVTTTPLSVSAAVVLPTSTPTNNTGTSNVTSTSAHGNTYSESQTGSINGLVHNTLRKTRSDMKVIHRYLVQVKHDTRDIHQIPYYELDQYIQDFVLTAKKKDGHEYEPESLKAFVHSLERHLKHHDYPHSVLKGSAFTGTRAVLNQRLNELRALSRSSGSTNLTYASVFGTHKRTVDDSGLDMRSGHTPAVLNKRTPAGKSLTTGALIQSGHLGKENPQAVLNSLWLINRTQFNIGGTQRHRNLVWGQFQLVTDDHGVKAIKFTPIFESAEVRYCRGYGGGKNTAADFAGRSTPGLQTLPSSGLSKRQPLPFNCVELFELYANLRPVEARGVSEPFYLCPESTWEQSGNWFKTSAAGSQLLSRIPRLLGLKPSREPPVPLDPSRTEARDISRAELTRDSFLTNGDRNAPFGQASIGLPKHVIDSSFPAVPVGSGLPAGTPPLGPNLFNLFPFMFNCSTESGGPSMPSNPYLIPSTAYTNLMMNNSTNAYSTRFDPDTENQTTGRKQPNLNPVTNASEVDELSQANQLDLRRPKTSPNQSVVPSPPSHPAPSSDGTPSPTDAENLSLSDTSPRQSYIPGAASSTPPTSLPKSNCPSIQPTESGDRCSSRKHSGSSNESVKVDQTTNGVYERDLFQESHVEHSEEPIEAISLVESKSSPPPRKLSHSSSEYEPTWSNEAVNLTRCPSEESNCV